MKVVSSTDIVKTMMMVEIEIGEWSSHDASAQLKNSFDELDRFLHGDTGEKGNVVVQTI